MQGALSNFCVDTLAGVRDRAFLGIALLIEFFSSSLNIWIVK